MANTFRNKKAEEGLDEDPNGQIPGEPPQDEVPQQEEQENAKVEHEADDNGAAAPKKSRKRNMASNLFGGEFLLKDWVRRQRWLLLMIVGFCLLLVSNRYVVEHLMRVKMNTEERIKYLREQRIQMKQEFQDNVKISHIASKLDSTGVGLIAGPPYELEEESKK
ncbi:MAG: FtsL-like putative cell division protein [Bacteroidales bacterium]|nr:FtsL-like putative cell division protein [Bacteroidales bacterium]